MKIKSKKVTLDSLDKKIVKIEDRLSGFATKNDIIDFKDEILGEIRDMRLETTFSFPK